MTTVTSEVLDKLVPKLDARIKRNENIRKFITLDSNDMVDIPRRSTEEHKKIAEYSKAPWAEKIINSRVRRLMVSGIRDAEGSSELAWKTWKSWRMTAKQKTAYREAVTYGDSFIELRKSGNTTTPFNKSPLRSCPFYSFDDFDDAFNSDHPLYFIEKNATGDRWKVWDNTTVSLWEKPKGSKTYHLVSEALHGFDVVPMVRYINDIDSLGRSVGVIEPLIPTLLRIMKATYDSGMINHNNSWHVRYVAGLSSINDVQPIDGETPEEYNTRVARMEEGLRLELGSSDLLTSTDVNTKFGSLPATPPGQFIPVIEGLLKELASLSDTPSDYVTGDVVGLSAEQSANSQANYLAVIKELRAFMGEAHETLLRLHGRVTNITEDYFTSVTWEETDTGTIAAVVDALGKSATMLEIPVEVLWEQYPNMTPEKLETWKEAARVRDEKKNAAMNSLMMMGKTDTDPEMIIRDTELEE